MKKNQHPLYLTVFFALTLICCITNAAAQPLIGQQIAVGASLHDNFHCMILTSDSGFIAGGSSDSPVSGDKTQPSRGFYDYWVVKFNKFGKVQWNKTIGGNNNDMLELMLQTADGGYLLAGSSLSGISGEKSENPVGGTRQDIWLVKLNNKGQVQWDKTIGGDAADYPSSLKQTSDGGYVIGGRSNSGVSGNKTEPNRGPANSMDCWLVKLKADGTIAWDKTLGGKNDDQCNDIIETADGGFLAGGLSNSGISGDKTAKNKGYYDMWVVKLSNNGAKLWDKTYGGSSFDGLNQLLQTSDGGFILAGFSDSDSSGDKSENSKGSNDFWFVKTNATGYIQFDKTIGGNADDYAYSIQQTWDNGYIVAGTSTSGISGNKTEDNRGDRDFWIVKFNKAGTLLWDKTIGGNAWDDFVTIRERRPNQFFIGGFSQSPISGDKTVPTTEADYWLVELKYYPHVATETTDAIKVKPGDQAGERFSIYPNPAKNVLYIQSSKQAIFTLTDQSGSIVFTKQVSGTVTVDVAKLAPGIYYLSNKSSGIVKKIIVAR